MSVSVNSKGYLTVLLSKDNRQRNVPLHVIVLTAFRGPKPTAAHQGCHGDGDKRNPRLSNLRWGTPRENINDQVLHGTMPRGEKSGHAILTEEAVRWARESAQKTSELARIFGVAQTTMREARSGGTWAHL
jgi:hypothetical protein